MQFFHGIPGMRNPAHALEIKKSLSWRDAAQQLSGNIGDMQFDHVAMWYILEKPYMPFGWAGVRREVIGAFRDTGDVRQVI